MSTTPGGLKVVLETNTGSGVDVWELEGVTLTVGRRVRFDLNYNFPGQEAESRVLVPLFGQVGEVSVEAVFQVDYVDTASPHYIGNVLDKIRVHSSPAIAGTQTLKLVRKSDNVVVAQFPGRVEGITLTIRDPTVASVSLRFEIGMQ